MALPAIIGIIGKILGAMGSLKGLTDEEKKGLSEMQPVSGQKQTVGQALNQSQQQQGGGFMNKAGTIAGILGSLRSNRRQSPGYYQMSRR